MGVELESRKMEAVSSYLMQRLARPDFVLCYYCVHIQKHTPIIEKIARTSPPRPRIFQTVVLRHSRHDAYILGTFACNSIGVIMLTLMRMNT